MRLSSGTRSVRNHLAVRDTLRRRADLRGEYAAVEMRLASDRTIGIEDYVARKSGVLQEVPAESDLTASERRQILELNDPPIRADA
ncbi:GrpB family protein [Georgenia sp. AZ-5]|uniref:GrpB family protein n=1 Tax=Georgenia sp. AZ-5 TaxID=3367526 RepID=UPI0037542990